MMSYRQLLKTPGNWARKAAAMMVAAGIENKPFVHIDIYHDDWCALLEHKGPCDCDPNIKLRVIETPRPSGGAN